MKFTIFTPTILRQSLIKACNSVTAQTHADWEHIVVVDTDIKNEILAQIEHPQRKIIFCKTPHGGWGHQCTHEAYPLATGDWVYRLDDDNYLANDHTLADLAANLDDKYSWAIFPILRYGTAFFHDPPEFQKIDTGSFIVKREFAQWANSPRYEGDWETVKRLLDERRPYQVLKDIPLVMVMPESSVSPVPDGDRISIYTPCHDSRYLREAYESIRHQAFHEWIIVYNNGAVPLQFDDPRIKEHVLHKAPERVGALKAYACEQATGGILLELDHDDLLMPTALYEVREAFSDPEIGFVYSNAIPVNMDGSKREKFSEIFGWRYREAEWNGKKYDETVSFDPTPEAVSRIWYAPDHLRAFRRSVYRKIGGYDKSMQILDDQDIMSRMYLVTKFHHIDKPLYIYRVHGRNSWLRFNQDIQAGVWGLYDKYIHRLVNRWAEAQGLGIMEFEGSLAQLRGKPAGSYGVIHALDSLCRVRNGERITLMKQIERLLVPGGWLLATVPSTDGRGAFQDPRHVGFWNENCVLYYTDKRWAQYIGTPVRFQAPRLYTTEKDANQVCWTVFNLISLKDGYRPCGEIRI